MAGAGRSRRASVSLLAAAGTHLRGMPPDSPDFDKIANAVSKLKVP